jgi:hypothetical protein
VGGAGGGGGGAVGEMAEECLVAGEPG